MSAAKTDIEELRKEQEALLSESPRGLWKSVSELRSSGDALQQKRGQEFAQLPKDETETEEKKLSRRGFFKWMTAAGTLMAGTACQRRPKDYLVPYVNKPEGYTFGIPVWYASTAPNGLGVLVKTREGRPIMLEGNSDHPASRGGMDSQTQASILNLYNPERLQAPVGVKSGNQLSWREVDVKLRGALKAARPGSIRILSDEVTSPTLRSVISKFTGTYKAQHQTFSAVPHDHINKAFKIVTGDSRIPYFDFSKADVVLSVDADFLGTWLRPVEFTKDYSTRRSLHDGDMNVNRHFAFESMPSMTGVKADSCYTLKPSQKLKLLLAVASELGASVDSSIRAIANKHSASSVAQEIGIAPEVIKEVAASLKAAKGRSLVVAGGAGPHSLECQLVVLAINSALGNFNKTLDWSRSLAGYESTQESFASLLEDATAGKLEVLIIQGCDPVYSRPDSDFAKVLKSIPLVISISPELNETTAASHIAVGESHFLETWGDSEAIRGVFAVQQPTIMPLFNTRSFGEILQAWMSDQSVDYQDTVKSYWKRNLISSSNFKSSWNEQLKLGGLKKSKPSSVSASSLSGAAAVIDAAKFSSSELELATYENLAVGDGRHANNAWLQELPDPITKVTWENYAAVSPATAKKLGVNDSQSTDHVDVLLLKTSTHSMRLPAFVLPGLADGVVGVALGYGRQKAGSLGTAAGQNAFRFASTAGTGALEFSPKSLNITNTGDQQLLATTQRHFDLHGRDNDILNETTLAKFKKNPRAARERDYKNFSMYPKFEYPGHRWGMNIDLNKCTGCNVCVVACQSENNIPVVGKEEVAIGRHMAWMRLDLYHRGDADKLESSDFQPMFCQQCERAPCETVCPVLATVHSSDGLNDMSYNRCVGTRYCANNCPYKVRRFNYFQYSDALGGKIDVTADSPLAMVLNPDVTVRTRGVMEKCTFCVQRIRSGVDEFKAKGEKRVTDGTIKTACQSSCPAGAIEFGDLNDGGSKVSELSNKAQAYKVLDVLNTNPSVTYMPRVRNKGTA